MDKIMRNNNYTIQVSTKRFFNVIKEPFLVKKLATTTLEHRPKSVTPNSCCCSTVNSTFDENNINFRQRTRFVTKARAQIIVKVYATNENENIYKIIVVVIISKLTNERFRVP